LPPTLDGLLLRFCQITDNQVLDVLDLRPPPPGGAACARCAGTTDAKRAQPNET